MNSKIYIDKTELIDYINSVLRTAQKYICVSRPRRFGKSMAANMLTAYYGRGCNSKKMFQNLKISQSANFETYLNQYNVIHLNMRDFLSESDSMRDMISEIQKIILFDLKKEFSEVEYYDSTKLQRSLKDVFLHFIFPLFLSLMNGIVFFEYIKMTWNRRNFI